MSRVTMQTVTAAEADIRLDRWFRRHFPTLGHGRLEKLLRTGQVRVDGKRAKSGQRLREGQAIRIPPLDPPSAAKPDPASTHKTDDQTGSADRETDSADRATDSASRGHADLAADLAARILYMDEELLALDKPAGIPVQGGVGARRNIDDALDGLRFGFEERPRLVHRLDKDTSGVLLLARTYKAARWLTAAFRERAAEKIYWAIITGELRPRTGVVDLAIAKLPSRNGEKMQVDRKAGRRATTDFAVIEQLSHRAAFVALRPRTGRTHQLRVHMQALGAPILGDGKYGGAQAFLDGETLSRKLHLHARSITITRPGTRPGGPRFSVSAPLPDHMIRCWKFFGFEQQSPEIDWPPLDQFGPEGAA